MEIRCEVRIGQSREPGRSLAALAALKQVNHPQALPNGSGQDQAGALTVGRMVLVVTRNATIISHMIRSYTPTPNELHDCKPVPFVEDEYFDADETREPHRVAMRKARHEAREAARVAEAIAHVEKIRREGRDLGPGIVKGYAYRLGQANRRRAA